MNVASPDEDYRLLSRRLSWVVTAAFVVVIALMALLLLVVTLRFDALGSRTTWRLAFAWTPIAFYIWALWGLRRVFTTLAKEGLVFTLALGRAVATTGWGLLLGGGATLAALPRCWRSAPRTALRALWSQVSPP